jgi:hypothetical protein
MEAHISDEVATSHLLVQCKADENGKNTEEVVQSML